MSVLVLGSINMDLTTYVPRLPKEGETLQGHSYLTVPGGKGNNQAVAASRLCAKTHLVGRVGDDLFGRQVMEIIAANQVDVKQVIKDPENHTGLAVISVDDSANNVIVIISGANYALDKSDVKRAESLMDLCKVLMVQLEIPAQISLAGVKAAKEKGLSVIFDPAPALNMPKEAYPYIDLFTPNETETEMLTGILPQNEQDAARAAKIIRDKGTKAAIIKMGAKGVFFEGPAEKGFIPAFKVKAIDTVAAGDAFNAGLAVAISEGAGLSDAVRWGAAAGAIATTRQGALPAMPYRDELEKLFSS